MSIRITPGMVIKEIGCSKILEGMIRVLHVIEVHNLVFIIPIQPKRSGRHLYFVGPKAVSFEKIVQEISNHQLHILVNGITPRPDAVASDDDLDKKYLRPGQSISTVRKKRHQRYALIKPLIEDHEEWALLMDPQVRYEKIV